MHAELRANERPEMGLEAALLKIILKKRKKGLERRSIGSSVCAPSRAQCPAGPGPPSAAVAPPTLGDRAGECVGSEMGLKSLLTRTGGAQLSA